MRRTFVVGALMLAAGSVLAAGAGHDPVASPPPAGGNKAADTQAVLRDLWLGHIFWVRNVVSETLAGNAAAAKAAEDQVVANAKSIAGAIEPYYGKAASEKLFGQLAGHYAALKEDLRANDRSAQDVAFQKLATNAEEIARFLGGANPNLPVETLRSLLIAHGGHHVQQIRQLRDRDYAGEAETWERMKQHMYVIADALAGAIVKQFPARFG